MKNTACTLCSFENPKLTVTAIIIKNNELMVAKRNEEPFKGQWDFIGGYVQKNETPEQALQREIKEELNVNSRLTRVGAFTGTASYQEYDFPILSLAYLAELEGDITLSEENSEISWVPISKLKTIAFDSNQQILNYLKGKFIYDIENIGQLVYQLDPSAVVREQSIYKAILNGYVSRLVEDEKIVGLGWIFPRQTLLRKQAVVEDMIVDQTKRGQGLGEKILKDLIKWAKDEGIEVVELTTNPRRIAANNLYQKVGFKLHTTNHYLLDLRDYKF